MKKRLVSVSRIAMLALTTVLSGTAISQTVTSTFNFTGGIQTFTVPCGIDTVYVQAWGAQGGSGATGGNATLGGDGGLGGYAEGYLVVTPGDVLNIFVGGQGTAPTGGFNGGANGGSTNAGGGGGASDVRVGGTSESNRVLTAGGGGGGGRAGCEGSVGSAGVGGNGGSGGGGVGANGADSPTSGGVAGGGKGGNFASVQGAAGAAGIGCGGFLGAPGATSTTGTGATGGAGQSCCCFSFPSIPGGGGGGGGQIGGGGGGGGSAGTSGCSGNDKGAGGGGGGGSSYTGGVLNGATNDGIWLGNGVVSITYSDLTPVASLTTPLNQFCVGDTVSYTATSTNNATVYTWNTTGDLSIISGQGTNTVAVVGSGVTNMGTIEVYAYDGVCDLTGPATTAFTVLVNALPTVTANSSDNDFCAGGTTTLTGGGTATSFVWDNGVNDGDVVTPANTTVYTVVGTDANGCSAEAAVTVTVNPLPAVALNGSLEGTVCGNQDITLTGTPSGGTYSVVSGTAGALTGNIFNAQTQGTWQIAYTYTDGNGCSNADTLDYNVNCLLGLEILGANGTVNIYPNPSNGNFTINSGVAITGTVELFDEMGRLVYTQAVSQMKNKQFEVKNLTPGIYNITITNGGDVYSGKMKVVK
ncbi:MAG: T9SS type A sorting domain-containing protein [Fluviicola sp.]|nr:T9SS type A sorting domain-containing protein [Fluviicola sp.]